MLQTVDALGDVMTYVGPAVRLPVRAVGVVRQRLGLAAHVSDELAEVVEEGAEAAQEGLEAQGDAARAISREGGEGAREASQRGRKGNKPALEKTVRSDDGHDFHVDLRKVSPTARHVIR